MTTTTSSTTGVFNYADPSTLQGGPEKPWAKVDTNASSYGRAPVTLPVHNLRAAPGYPASFTIDTSGFAVYHSPSSEKLFLDDKAIREGYYAEVESLLRSKLAGVSRVVIFDHTIRRRDPAAARQPVQNVHVDQTPRAAEARVRRHVNVEDAERLVKGRYQIVNVWRPIGWEASDMPLAVVDWRSTEPGDLVAVDLLYPTREGKGADDDGDDRGKEVLPDAERAASTDGYEVKGETYAVKHNDRHRLYYVKDMTPDEAMLIKCFDSRSEGQQPGGGIPGVAALTPHTAFVDPATPPDAKGRQSIEVRCLVFYE